jgi:hypothetical protein
MTKFVKPSTESDMEVKTTGTKANWFSGLITDIVKRLTNKEDQKSAFIVTKELDGSYRWFGVVTNKWKDRDGDILVDSAHVEFNEFLDANPQYAPELWTWHTPGTARKHKADWWDYYKGFFLYSGPLTEEEGLEYKETNEPIGMSHGFYVIEKVGRFILKYRTFEVSELPLESAANPFTSFQIKEEQKSMFSQRKRAYLVNRFGEDKVKQLEGDVDAREKALQEMNVEWKEVNEQYETEIENTLSEKIAEASKTTVESIVSEVVKALNVDQLREVLGSLNEEVKEVKSFGEKIDNLQEQIDALKVAEDERVAKALTPPDPFDWTLAASNSKENIVKEENVTPEVEKELNGGEFDWLAGFNPGLGGN